MAVAHKGSISMGMVLIPIGLYKTTVDNDIHFNQLEKESLKEAIMKKIQGQEIVVADTGAPDNVIDLMEALKKSLEQTKDSPKGKKKAGTA